MLKQHIMAMYNSGCKRRGSAAFSLIELIAVVVVIGVLVMLIIPMLASARESAADVRCKNNLRQLGMAVLLYTGENRVYPRGDNPLLTQELAPFLNPLKSTSNVGTDIDECPARTIVSGNTGEIDRSYGSNPFLFVDGKIGDNTDANPRLDVTIVQRTSESILMMDACQRPNAKAHMRMGNIMGMMSAQSLSQANRLLDPGADLDGTQIALYRFRHRGNYANAVHADGSVTSYEKGTLKQRNFAIAY